MAIRQWLLGFIAASRCGEEKTTTAFLVTRTVRGVRQLYQFSTRRQSARLVTMFAAAPVETSFAGRREEARLRVIVAWALWEEKSLLKHLSDEEKQVLLQVLQRASQGNGDVGLLEARLEVAEVMLTVQADGAAVCAAFEAAMSSREARRLEPPQELAIVDTPVEALASEIRELRSGLSAAIAAETVAVIEARNEAVLNWQLIDEAAASVRRTVAFATRDARALVAELAAVVVALRRGEADVGRARALALQAVHVHLPLGELLRLAEERRASREQLFIATRYADLLKEIEDRAYSRLFPETYALLRWKAARARALCKDVDAFALEARSAIARILALDGVAIASCLGSREVAITDVVHRLECVLLVTVRVKTAASAIRKMLRRKQSNLAAVRDLVGLRIVVDLPQDRDDLDEIAALYAVHRAVSRLWPELQGRFKDYVRRPKASGYQSLHTTVWLEEMPMEVQVRTAKMHATAESGEASHALYSGTRRDASLAFELGEFPLHERRLLPPGSSTQYVHAVAVDAEPVDDEAVDVESVQISPL